ncbi:MAG: hypothetical protein IJU45_04425 [Clostridia bacterium]|nr:hypothetical protein [Clostridia bacterium]
MREKKSKWTQRTHILKDDEFICKNCGYSAKKAVKTCPGCGAKMTNTNYIASWVDEMDFLDWEDDD